MLEGDVHQTFLEINSLAVMILLNYKMEELEIVLCVIHLTLFDVLNPEENVYFTKHF